MISVPNLLQSRAGTQVSFMQKFVSSVKKHLDPARNVDYYVNKLAEKGFTDTERLSKSSRKKVQELCGLYPGEAQVLWCAATEIEGDFPVAGL